jgi:hypothetical protein
MSLSLGALHPFAIKVSLSSKSTDDGFVDNDGLVGNTSTICCTCSRGVSRRFKTSLVSDLNEPKYEL